MKLSERLEQFGKHQNINTRNGGLAEFIAMAKELEANQKEVFDWSKAKANLDAVRKQYVEIGSNGVIGLYFLNELLVRYDKGERNEELYRSMMDAQ
jgi:hypothetical protein